MIRYLGKTNLLVSIRGTSGVYDGTTRANFDTPYSCCTFTTDTQKKEGVLFLFLPFTLQPPTNGEFQILFPQTLKEVAPQSYQALESEFQQCNSNTNTNTNTDTDSVMNQKKTMHNSPKGGEADVEPDTTSLVQEAYVPPISNDLDTGMDPTLFGLAITILVIIAMIILLLLVVIILLCISPP